MKALKNAVDFITGRRSLIKDNIGGSGMYLIDKMPAITSRKARTFFHHSIICCVTDAFEYFLNVDSSNNIFYKNINKITEETGERFIKWETVYHTLFFTNVIRGSEEIQEFENALFLIFEFEKEEKESYFEFKRLLTENETEFVTSFSKASAKDIFTIEEITGTDAGFIYNFYYNCYTEFYRTYSKYSIVADANMLTKETKPGEGACLEIGSV